MTEVERAMSKTLLYRLFGVGKIPEKIRPTLESEGIVVSDEGMGGWYVTRDFSAPGKRFINRKEGFSGCMVVTRKRLVCYTNRKRQINISVDDPGVSALYVALTGSSTFAVSFESSMFRDDCNGIIELRFKSGKAREFYDVMRALGVQQGAAADARQN